MLFFAAIIKLRPVAVKENETTQKELLSFSCGKHFLEAVCGSAEEEPSLKHQLEELNEYITVGVISTYTLRITFLGSTAVNFGMLLLSNMPNLTQLQIDRNFFEIESINLESSEWTGVANWSDFVVKKEGISECYIRFDFTTPVLLPAATAELTTEGLALPEPEAIFSWLAARWQFLGGPILPEGLERFLRNETCFVSEYQIESKKIELGGKIYTGLMGYVLFDCKSKRDKGHYPCTLNSEDTTSSQNLSSNCYILALAALAQFAPYSGLGYYTEAGMGMIKAKVSLEPWSSQAKPETK
jgi:hypothetical protein